MRVLSRQARNCVPVTDARPQRDGDALWLTGLGIVLSFLLAVLA